MVVDHNQETSILHPPPNSYLAQHISPNYLIETKMHITG